MTELSVKILEELKYSKRRDLDFLAKRKEIQL